ncbi:catalase [Brevibacterium antiquum]|uniref:catalase n=1 Tax=Brevibacterium antiquum TaxID=234835 RepID=UPI0018DFC5C8|nr:catalase [Brevibacterium antiquum]
MPSEDSPFIPGKPASSTPKFDEPQHPQGPPSPKSDQSGPKPTTPTGADSADGQAEQGQQGEYHTTAQGGRLPDTNHSLKAGPRGPVLLQDHHLREKITHFDHERIPERVVHARGAAAHGTFVSYGTASNVTKAGFLQSDAQTEVFTRFSTVVGSRGSADAARDTRGFATKFYTSEGVFDLVGNNFPVFFIQDALKFPDIVHAAKPHPDREIPQAQSAHDTFWDFVSLHTEATHHTMWQMSDRAIPRSFRMMEGFGVHTFRLENAAGETSLVKFHWKPQNGVHSLLWEEAQMVNGFDPDFHRRDLADAIEAGAYPKWELGLQVMPDSEDEMFEGIDLLDPTKLVPEELAPVKAVGVLTLDRNPENYFAETEQVAFHPGHLVPGIDVTNDPLLQGRLFSYLDTQISRLGGPNFSELPINRPRCPVNDMFRDGMHQTAVHQGIAPYKPNSLDGGNPFSTDGEHALIDIPQRVAESVKERRAPKSFDDHFSQPSLFWKSLTEIEQQHLADAFIFELGKCYEETIRRRELKNIAAIDAELCETVATGLGLDTPQAGEQPPREVTPSPALSQIKGLWPVTGRKVGIVVSADTPFAQITAVRAAVGDAGMVPLLIAPRGGRLGEGSESIAVERTYATMRSVEFDAVILTEGVEPSTEVDLLISESWRHLKPIATCGSAVRLLEEPGIEHSDAGIFCDGEPGEVTRQLIEALSEHRAWARAET